MPEPLAPQPQQGSWTDLILPFAIGAGSLASGFAAGRNPGAENPGAAFLQPLQTMSLLDYRTSLGQHYGQLGEHYKQQERQTAQNTAVQAARTAVEMGDINSIQASKDQLGPYFPQILQAAQTRRGMLQREGFLPPDQPQPAQGQFQGGLPTVPPLGPGSAAMPTPSAPPQEGYGEPSPYRSDVTKTFSMGGLSSSRRTPGTTEPQMVTEFLGRYPSVPAPVQLQADLARENAARQARGIPSIAWTKDAQDVYEKRLFWERPELYRRMKLTEQSVNVPPEVAGIALEQEGQGGQPVNPFAVQSQRDIGRAVQRETQVGTARQDVERRYARLPEGERTRLQEMDDVLMNAAGVLDLKQDLIARYGNRPGFMAGPLERVRETLGQQDPQMTRFLDLYGKLYNAARKRIAGTAVSAGEKQALETYLKDPRGNINTVFKGIEDIFRTTLVEGQRAMATAKTYGGEDISPYAYNKIVERRKKGGKLMPELSEAEAIKRAPKLRYNPATKAIESMPEG